jgi:hypothetical protein
MPRWVVTTFITCYLSAMGWGIVSHTFKIWNTTHPGMYFLVWDMFCGWSSHEIRFHLVAEGESGEYYDLAPAPWGAFEPFSGLARHHYDSLGNGLYRMANNTLRHTDHEPIRRILIFEETWSKKYNVPDYLWTHRFEEPKDPHRYYWQFLEYTPEGQIVRANPNFLSYHYSQAISDNPRLIGEYQGDRAMYAVHPSALGRPATTSSVQPESPAAY